MADPVLYEVRNGRAWITLNSPENHNALSQPLCEGLAAAVQRATDDASARMIVLTGVGRSFCAGADLKGRGGWMRNGAKELQVPDSSLESMLRTAVSSGTRSRCTIDQIRCVLRPR